jgi:hypothetical protein
VVAAAIVAALLFWPRSEPGQQVEEIPFDDVVKEHEQMVADEPETPTDEAVAAAQEEIAEQGALLEEEAVEELTLVASATQRCYLRITADRDTIPMDDVVLEAGMSRTYFADSLFTVVVGNAAGMELILDGLNLGELGEEGRVVTVIIGEEGIRRLRLGVRRTPSHEQNRQDPDTLEPAPIPDDQLLPRSVRSGTTAVPRTTQPDTVVEETPDTTTAGEQ